MSPSTTKRRKTIGFLRELGRKIAGSWRSFRYRLAQSGARIRNRLRLLRRIELDYVVMPVGGPLPERSGPPRNFIQRRLPLPPEPLSMEELNRRLSAVADADNVHGIVFIFRGFSAGLSTLQNFRDAVTRLRSGGKDVVVYTPYLDLAHYFAATAANRIIVPPAVTFDVFGLRSEALFFKDALDQIGIEADVIQISPYKTAYNLLDKRDITPEQHEQLDWLLDDLFDLITTGMANGRDKTPEEIRSFIDSAPLQAQEALEYGLVDDLAYEDQLASLLGRRRPGQGAQSETGEVSAVRTRDESDGEEAPERPAPARLATWAAARSLLLERPRRPTRSYIGVVSLEGTIVMGTSRQPPVQIPLPVPFVDGAFAGEETITQQLRRVEQDDRLAALILHIDSGGGSALASDLIWRQLVGVASRKPVIAYMGNVAASGGYYVAAPAVHIVSQPMTVTGSIGVLTAHVATQGLYEKLHINRVILTRGERAALLSGAQPLSDEERQAIWEGVVSSYERFKEIVAEGRNLPVEDLDPICEGRVWTGRQARARDLVNTHGDFEAAVDKAIELAGLPREEGLRVPVFNIYPDERQYMLPRAHEPVEALARLLWPEHLRDLLNRPLALMPFTLRIW
ncbi:MAG: signal peptide peptidase SppA [Candidatus Promineifilaceae bacterium]